MATKLENLFTPGGRFVMGSLSEKEDKDINGNPIPPDKQAYFFGVAVPKSDPTVGALIGQIYQAACTDYANAPLVMAQIQQGLAAKDFSWKIEDGDLPTYDRKTGALRETPEYIKGCFIFKFRTMYEISACNAQGVDINRAKDIRRGDYVDVLFSAVGSNGKVDDTAGVYLNPQAIRLLGYGEPISGGVKASSAFANRAVALPPGASAMPTAQTAGATGMPGAGMPGAGNPAPVGGQTALAGMPGGAMPGAGVQTGTASAGNPGYTPGPMTGMPGM